MTKKKAVEPEKKYAVSPKVVKLVKKVQKHILEEPKRLYMGSWVNTGTPGEYYAACGTTACIAGWVAILSRPLKFKENGCLQLPKLAMGYQGDAAKKLEIEDSDSTQYMLFHVDNWPSRFQSRYYDAQGDRTKQAQATVDRLEYFLETGN